MTFENNLWGSWVPIESKEQNKATFTSRKVTNLKSFIQNEQIMEAACNEQAKMVCTLKIII